MPIYEYECGDCGQRTEVIQRLDEAPLTACPSCGGEVRRLISAPALQFKGTGWYVTDYAGKKGGDGKEKAAEGGDGDGKKAPSGKGSGAEPAASATKKEKPESAKAAD